MHSEFLVTVFGQNRDADALVWKDRVYPYGWLLDHLAEVRRQVQELHIPAGSVVILEADFSPLAVALFLALLDHNCVLVPLTGSVAAKHQEFTDVAEAEYAIAIDDQDQFRCRKLDRTATHPLYQELRRREHPGLVLFSSGSTGKSKAAVHDLLPILEKFKVPKRRFRSIAFLLYDHIGGVNTMLYSLSNAGCVVTLKDRSPDAVCRAVEAYRVDLLPTSPTFLNLLLLSEAHRRYDLSSLRLITYGTEPMPESTLRRVHEVFPDVTLQQTYGLSELGILRSKSKDSGSLWVKIGGEGFQTRVVDGILQIKAESAMLGYLNAPSPFTEDGWFNTRDMVEQDGDYYKILGRQSEIINVGGEKVYPAEVESVIQQMGEVAEVAVYGEKNPLVGQIVCATVRLFQKQPAGAFVPLLKRHCRERLQSFKVPVKVTVTEEPLYNARFKKARPH